MVPTSSAERTRSLAAALAPLIRPGDLLVLDGDLGAGKTVFAQGLGGALGVDEPIRSPTFTIERIHTGQVRLHHLDLYRLGTVHEVLDLDLDEALDTGGVLVVEWGQMLRGALDRDHLAVTIRHGDGDEDRSIRLEPVGPAWTGRAAALRDAVDRWRSGEPAR